MLIRSLIRPHRCSASPPVNLAPGDEACFAREQSRSFPRVTARLLRNACVSSEGICTVGNRLVQLPVLLTPGMPLTVRQCVKTTVTVARRALSGLRGGRSEHVRRALLLTDVHFDGFFHWFGDILPKRFFRDFSGKVAEA